ncbi:MAG: hypothetical protein ACJ77M_05920 [Thermoleophilaceae bacterium]
MLRRARAVLAVSAAAALAAALPAAAFGQASAGNGSAAQEYGDYVPTTSGGSATKHHSSTPPRVHHSTPRYVPPVRQYTPPVSHAAPSVAHSAPGRSAAPANKPRHHKKRHHPHHAAAVHKVAKPTASAHKSSVSVPAAPAASVDGGSRQLVVLGLAMLTMTVAVFARTGWRRRHGSV